MQPTYLTFSPHFVVVTLHDLHTKEQVVVCVVRNATLCNLPLVLLFSVVQVLLPWDKSYCISDYCISQPSDSR